MKLPADYTKMSAAQRRDAKTEYMIIQEGNCYWCKEPLDNDPPKTITSKWVDWRKFPPNFLRYTIHLQHCHKTGMTEGAVHAYCNAVMWQYHGR